MADTLSHQAFVGAGQGDMESPYVVRELLPKALEVIFNRENSRNT